MTRSTRVPSTSGVANANEAAKPKNEEKEVLILRDILIFSGLVESW